MESIAILFFLAVSGCIVCWGRANFLVTRTPIISAFTGDANVERELVKGHPLQRLGEPDEIANAALFLASDMSDGITALNMSVDGGLHGKLGL